ncbi:B3 domain-containing protein At5g18000-like isoform X1 [Brassica napus]|uniref:B3 domain-containing protein At5g18000-like isoform X1 n=1 Tax=Brassica napus TaxID=3708 RepID=UPI0006AAE6C4|nr:B3 domain-containing protein At5g18000-like isoform X1 [Brassica napus]
MATNSYIAKLMEESDNPGFFKVLRKEDLSSQTMREIPQDFLKSISAKEFSFKMVLKLPSWGSSWLIDLSKYQSFFYYMEQNGWDQFLSDNGLGDDELLTFTHKGNMCFNVSIYKTDCVEILRPKRSATIASSSRNKREEVNNVLEEERESLSASNYPVSETAESTVGGRLKQKRQLINLGKKQVKKAEKANKCKKRKMDTESDDSEAGTSSLVSEFTLTVKKSYVLFLVRQGVPKRFAEMHMPKEETVFKIHGPKGKKSWEVTYVVSKIQSRFSRGWPGLVKDFGLEVGDVCTFELIKPTEMILTVSK